MGTPSWIELHPIAASRGPDCRVYRIGVDQSAGDANIEQRPLSISPNGRYGTSRGIAYIGLMLAATITLPHFLVSSEMSLPKSAGEPGSTVPPRLASRALNFGSAMLILTSLFSLSMSSTGVLFGAPMPNHALAS